MIFEAHSRVFKTHSGVQSEFARLTKDDPRFTAELRVFLGRGYQLKSIADYETGPDAKVTAARAREAVEMARRFVAAIVETLSV